ncbi:unnamed protein product [Eruca vesicaria subsp. sativa]|uniref:Uncharacterized protein n=1 Tax=Eruca vesicaria subsp. sativa TaxID=29727 RepID=A0ABC8LUK9_ERUVS|nr:unnamed protein product [Eruca vesicaria subsp. sativa]
MNPTHNNSASTLAPPQPHRPSTSCDRHPEERFTGFCPSCLFERLSVLDINTVASSSRKPPSSSAAALKSIFKPSSSSSSSAAPPSLFPELRRTKSFSARKNEALLCLGAFEPQRRSCDVKVRNTLWSLFNEDNSEHIKEGTLSVKEGTLRVNSEISLETRKPIKSSPVFEEGIDCGKKLKEQRSLIDEIIEEEDETEKVKEHIEMNPPPPPPPPTTTTTKKPTRSFWSAASVLSKKLQKWRQKQKLKKHRGGGGGALPVEKSVVRQLRDTQSEVAEYGYGRRSCDTDPRFSIDAGRFSLDAGRVSVDDHPRYSFDEPRASWDGYMIGRTVAAPPRMPSMLSVVEDSPVSNHVLRSDSHIPVEEQTPPPPGPESVVPGGSEQTREYYNDSSTRRRKSLDRCSSTRKLSASVIAEIDELKLSASNTKISPKHSRSRSSSVRGDCSVENLEMGGRETVESSKKGMKKSKRWSWNIFGLLHRKNGNKYEEEEDRSGVDRTFSGSWNVESRNGFDPKMMRSNSSVSWRSSAAGGGGFQRNSVDGGYISGKKKVSNSSSTSIGRKVENGMLKFNLTPSKGRRTGSMDSTSRPVPASHPLGRNVMNYY